MSLEVHIDWQGQPHLVGRLYAADRERRFLLSMRPNGFNATMPLRLTRHRFRSNGARITVGHSLGRFRIADLTVGDES